MQWYHFMSLLFLHIILLLGYKFISRHICSFISQQIKTVIVRRHSWYSWFVRILIRTNQLYSKHNMQIKLLRLPEVNCGTRKQKGTHRHSIKSSLESVAHWLLPHCEQLTVNTLYVKLLRWIRRTLASEPRVESVSIHCFLFGVAARRNSLFPRQACLCNTMRKNKIVRKHYIFVRSNHH